MTGAIGTALPPHPRRAPRSLLGTITERNALALAATAEAERAVTAFDPARVVLGRKAAEGHLQRNARQIPGLIVQSIDELCATRDRNGGGLLAWRPERALMDRLVPLDNLRAW